MPGSLAIQPDAYLVAPCPIAIGFEQHDLHARGGKRIRGRAAGEPAADDDDV